MKEFFLIVGWAIGTAASLGIAYISFRMMIEIKNLVQSQYEEIAIEKELRD